MRTIVVFSGAGLSADSGLPTFRGPDGLWENHRDEDVAEHSAWFRRKPMVLRFYAERHQQYADCEPNPAHHAIARLQDKFNVVNLTQNIDDLLERAGCSNVVHIHGTIRRKKCEWHRGITTGDGRFICDYLTEADGPVREGDLCPKCGGQLRPDIVFFNEAVDFSQSYVTELVREVKYNDGVFICVGTSAQVYPAGYLLPLFCQVPKKYIVNPDARPIGNYELRKGRGAEEMPKLVEELLT